MLIRERSVPPSDGRLAAAARSGMFPTSGTWVSGLAFVFLAGLLAVGGQGLASGLVELVRGGLTTAVRGDGDPVGALVDGLLAGALLLLPFMLGVFVVAAAGAVLPAVWARRSRAGTTAP